jgi:hypothetical protein
MRAFVVLALLGGCGFAPKVVHLEPVAPVAATKAARSMCVKVARLTDGRSERRKIGVNRNGFGMAMGEVRTYGNVPDWIGQHLADELAPACRVGAPEFVLEGTVTRAWVDEYWNLDGDIEVTLSLRRAGASGPVFSQRFHGSHSQTSWAASESEFTDTFYQTLLDLSARVVPAVLAAS